MIVNSIIMTLFNRPPRVVWNTLHALRKNDLENCEIIIVDDGSTTDYSQQRAYAEQYEMPVVWYRIKADEYPDDTYYIEHPDGGRINNPALAMNRAIGWAKGRRLMFLSSDCMIPKFGIDIAKKCGDYYWIANVVDQATNAMYVCDKRPLPFHFFASCKREHVEAIGGFDENYLRGIAWEDNDFGARLGLYCRHVIFDSSVLVVHQSHGPMAYGDKLKGCKISERYTQSKWGGIPWEIEDGIHTDAIIKNPTRDNVLYRCNPRLKEGFVDPLGGKRR